MLCIGGVLLPAGSPAGSRQPGRLHRLSPISTPLGYTSRKSLLFPACGQLEKPGPMFVGNFNGGPHRLFSIVAMHVHAKRVHLRTLISDVGLGTSPTVVGWRVSKGGSLMSSRRPWRW